MSRRFNLATDYLVRHRLIAVLAVFVITAVAIIGYRAPNFFSRQIDKWTQDDDSEKLDEFDEGRFDSTSPDVPVVPIMGDAVIVCESEQFFTREGAKAMREVVKHLESLEHVESVQWLDRIPVLNIFGLPEPLYPPENSAEGRFQAAKTKALAHPLVRGLFLSDDGNLMLLTVSFDFLFVRSNDDCTTRLRTEAEKILKKYPDISVAFSVTGQVPSVVTAIETRDRNQIKYQLIGYGMILVMSILLFRGFASVVIVALAPCVGVFWTLGIIRYFGFHDSPFNDVILPIMISLVGFTDGVHLLVQIRSNRATGFSAFESARMGIQQVGLACALTSLTTAIGFGSLGLAHHQIVREFGYSCVMGVILTFIAVIILVPLACASPLGRWLHVGHGRGIVDRNLTRIQYVVEFVLRHKRAFSVGGIAATIALLAVGSTLRPDERRSNSLPESSEAAIAIRKLDERMGGLESGNVEVVWKASVPPDAVEILTVIREVESAIKQHELIGSPLSIADLLDSLPGEGTDASRFSMLELLPPPLKRLFYTPEYRSATIMFRCRDLGIARYGPVFQSIEDSLRAIEQEHPNFRLTLEGAAVWRWKNLYQIVTDLAASLGSAAVVIFLVLALAYRSLRIGLISIVPNLFPLALAATWLVLTDQHLEIVSVCAFTVCLGIAVDDTIHFLTRYREDARDSSDTEAAARRAFTAVGTALIMTTIVLVSGFSTVMFSDSRDHHIFASMGAITVTAALVGDLLFLPALLAWFDRQPRERWVDNNNGTMR
ncbi:MAG: efflux RND transporter permease subunit [Pirellulaceae bacterium]